MADYFITGVSSGIGRALAGELVRRGHRVWGIARRRELLGALQSELGGQRFFFSVCDVARAEEVTATVQALDRASFRPDVVVLNAGVNPEGSGVPLSQEVFEQVIQVNLFGAIAWIHVFLPRFRIERRGHFVAISSLAAFRGDARWVAYAASKAALSRAFESLRGRHESEGLTFTTVHLGAVGAGMGAQSRSPVRLSDEKAARRIADFPGSTVSVIRAIRTARAMPCSSSFRISASRSRIRASRCAWQSTIID